MSRATPETDALSSDPVIERRDVPANVWRAMAKIERQRDAALDLLYELDYELSTSRARKAVIFARLVEERKP